VRKTFMGVRLKTLREQRGMTQAALALALKLSPSYLNQIENNQRPLTVPVLLRLQSTFGVDLQFFSEDEEARLTSDLREVLAESVDGSVVPMAEVLSVAQQMPAIAKALIRLHGRCRAAEERLNTVAAGIDGERDAYPAAVPLQPYEEVRDFFYARHNHMAVLDERAEKLFEQLHQGSGSIESRAGTGAADDIAALLEERLNTAHGITVLRMHPSQAEVVRAYDPTTRTLHLSNTIEPGQRAFQLATQIARIEAADLIDEFTSAGSFASEEARALARIGFANYFAGALLLPYRLFLSEAEALRYDIDLLGQRFGVSFETVCHRLSTMQRPDARGIPFFFVRVDRAGNVSKRQSATDFHFSRTGGTCPLWNVYEAFAQPGKVLTQLSRMPDGRTYLWIARSVSHGRGGYGTPGRDFAVALGCDMRHAHQLVYAKGIDLNDPEAATPIGAGCKVCDRENCAQRAFPALGRELMIDENIRHFAPYASGLP
jgi:predicted transcriptional regulator/DNA-binding XRE family transcriptional regulator